MAVVEFPKPVWLAVALVLIVAAVWWLMPPSVPSAAPNSSVQPAASASDSPLYKAGLLKAPELTGLTGYINAPANFTLASVHGKVVLVDFWTYSCINCLRTLPYLTDWYSKYHDKGLVIVGVHTPEFDFEKNLTNVQDAVRRFGITYPVVLDSDQATWNAFQNQYWPREYLIDADGYIRHDHAGEGGYEETETLIQQLLKERDAKSQLDNVSMPPVVSPDFAQIGTPEIYVGYQFARQPLGNNESVQPDQNVTYAAINASTPENALLSGLEPNLVYLSGTWQNEPDRMHLVSQTGNVTLLFQAKNAYIVAGSASGSNLTVWVNGMPLRDSDAGPDAVKNAAGGLVVPVHGMRLYTVVNATDYAPKLLTLQATQGFDLFTFTFG